MSPPFQLPDVDCIVVNRDGGDALFAALRCLESQDGIDLSVVVVDNASHTEERERLSREFPEVRVVAFSTNLGFAAAANEGIARTRAPFVLLLNNDAIAAPDYVARLAARLAYDERLGAVQGLVLTADGLRVDSAGLEWNARGEAVPLFSGGSPEAVPAGVFEVPGISATAGLYRRDALSQVASAGEVFDPCFFAYYEDVDLALRLSRVGWRFACDPAAQSRHEGSRTGRRTPWKRARWMARNRWRTLFRNFDRRWIRRNLARILRADLAHARSLGWRAPLLILWLWPAVALGSKERSPGGTGPLLDRWPTHPGAGRGESSEPQLSTGRRLAG